MIGLLQRVVGAKVEIGGKISASIGPGFVVLVGVKPSDTKDSARSLLLRLLRYRVFDDLSGRMNRSLRDIGGDLLLVPQFTLAAGTHKGLRPGFSSAAPPEVAHLLFDYLVELARAEHSSVQSGAFGAHMALSLTNDGPVTFWLES